MSPTGQALGQTVEVRPVSIVERGTPVEQPHIPPALLDPGRSCRAGDGVNGPRSGSRSDAGGAVEAGAGERHDPAEVGRATVDPDDTSRCPVAPYCATCGSPDALTVVSAGTPVGIICVTVCHPCADIGDLPRYSVPGAVRRCLEHAGHLGCTVDDLTPDPR